MRHAGPADGACRGRFGRAIVHQHLDPIRDALRRFPQLPDGPVGGVALGDVVGPGVVDKPFGQGQRQQQVALDAGRFQHLMHLGHRHTLGLLLDQSLPQTVQHIRQAQLRRHKFRQFTIYGIEVDIRFVAAARGGIEIDGDTTIIVDEAGMLSTRQAHHILQLSERHGAKIVFAGDTQQQQPVEAGPGLRLIRDAVGSVRVDRIRRQKADLEDILVHVRGENPEAARFHTGMMGEQERTRILKEYEAMEDKPAFTPWQVAASEALRDGDAASAIAAHHARGRFHIGYDEERTLTGLVDDWDRYQRVQPGKSSVVLARTRAEVRALSHLMRGRRFAALPDGKRPDTERVTVMVSRGTEDERTTSPLEIARGDQLRIGATHWEKQLFNGTVVTVDDFKVEISEAGTEPSVLISARTEDGRSVSFRHDEIRDWYGNIRLDHGYALTITLDFTPATRKRAGVNLENDDAQESARWMDRHGSERSSAAIFDLINADNIRSRKIAEQIDLVVQIKRMSPGQTAENRAESARTAVPSVRFYPLGALEAALAANEEEGTPQVVTKALEAKCPSGDFMSRMNRLSGGPS